MTPEWYVYIGLYIWAGVECNMVGIKRALDSGEVEPDDYPYSQVLFTVVIWPLWLAFGFYLNLRK